MECEGVRGGENVGAARDHSGMLCVRRQQLQHRPDQRIPIASRLVYRGASLINSSLAIEKKVDSFSP